MGYLCVNFGLLRPLRSRVIPDVRDRQTSDRRQAKASLNAPPRGRDIISGVWAYDDDTSKTAKANKISLPQTDSSRQLEFRLLTTMHLQKNITN